MKSVEKNSIQLLLQQTKLVLFVWFFPIYCFAQDSLSSTKHSHLQLHSYLKDMQTASFIDDSKSLVTGNFIHNRINFKWNVSGNLYFRAEGVYRTLGNGIYLRLRWSF